MPQVSLMKLLQLALASPSIPLHWSSPPPRLGSIPLPQTSPSQSENFVLPMLVFNVPRVPWGQVVVLLLGVHGHPQQCRLLFVLSVVDLRVRRRCGMSMSLVGGKKRL